MFGPRYKIPFRRRREGKTDYRQRFKLLSSGLPRFVVRVSNKHIRTQIITYEQKGDRTISSVSSMDLKKYGLKNSNTSCAYLVGLLCAKKAAKGGIKKAILDMGLHRAVKGGKIFACLKGALDGGLEIPHGDVLPSEERIFGKNPEEFKAVKEKIKNE